MGKRNKKVFAGYADTFSIEKVSVGYDKYKETIDKVEQEYSSMWYPPYNVRKINATDYAIDLEVTGYNKEEISASIEAGELVVTAPVKDKFPDTEGDDTYYHQGIFPGGDLMAKFYIADSLKLDTANYDDGVITFTFKATGANQRRFIVPIGPFEKSADAVPFVPKFNSDGSIIGPTGEIYAPEVVSAAATALAEVAANRDTVQSVVNTESESVPTVQVNLPDPLPQIVEVSATQIPDVVDPKSDEPQAVITVKDATYEVESNDVVTSVISTPDGQSDVVVAVPSDVYEELAAVGIDPVLAIEAAIVKEEVVAPALPPEEVVASTTSEVTVTPVDSGVAVTVVVPDTLPSVVEATVSEEGKVVLSDVSENIPDNATVTPVITAPGQPDIMVVTTPETDVKLDNLDVDVAKDIGDAVVKAEAEVAPAVVETPSVFESTPTEIVVNGESDTIPTVQVILPDPLPQILQVDATNVAVTVDPASEQPQVTLTVTEAVHEVSDNVVTDVIKTESGLSDIVIATPEDVHKDLADKGIDVTQAVTEAIAQSDLPAPEAPVVETTPVVEVSVVTDTGNEVTVAVPEVIPQIVQATVESTPASINSSGEPVDVSTTVTLTDVSTNVPENAELIPVVTAAGEHDVMVAVMPVDQAKLDVAGVDVAKDVGQALQDAQTEVVVSEPVSTATVTTDEVAGTSTVTLNENSETKPTVEVVLPDPLPQIVQVETTNVADPIDPTSSEPQVTLTVTDATKEVSDNVVTDVIKTDDGSSDVVVAIPEADHAELTAAGIDPVEAISIAIDKSEVEAPTLPVPEVTEAPTSEVTVPSTAATDPSTLVTVVVPDTLPSVVEATVEDGKVVLSDVSENIPVDATVTPVVTKEGEADIMVATTPETNVKLDEMGVDVAVDVSAAVISAAADVTPVEPAPETTNVVLNADNPEVPTVLVTVPDPLPQIVEVSAEQLVGEIDPKSSEPQVTLTVTDATYEVSDNVVTDVVETPVGSADTVVVVPEPLNTEMAEKGVDVIQMVQDAVKEAEPTPAVLPQVEEWPTADLPAPQVVNDVITNEPKVEVVMPDTISQVVQATVEAAATPEEVPTVTLTNVSEDIPSDATLTPVVTAPGQPDIMVAVMPEDQAKLDIAQVDVATDIGQALQAAETDVVKSEPVE